jgi:hypothetical protein
MCLLALASLGGCGDCEPQKLADPKLDTVEIGEFTVNQRTYTSGVVTVLRDTVQLDATDQDGNVWRITWERKDP